MKGERIIHWAKGSAIFCLAVFSLITLPKDLWAHPFSVNEVLPTGILSLSAQEGSKKIQVQIQEGTLCQALSDLEKKAQGLFKCPKSLNRIKVFSRTIRGSTWHSIVTQLLSDYNTILLWKNDKELESIYLLGMNSNFLGGSAAKRPLNKKYLVKPKPSQPWQARNRDLGTPGAGLSNEEIIHFKSQSGDYPLSEEFFKNPRFQGVLKMARVRSPEDWLDRKKQRRVKRHLSQLLKIKKARKSRAIK